MGALKYIFIIFCLIVCVATGNSATYYYIDNDSGDNSRTAAQAQNPATPWKTAPGMFGVWTALTGSWVETSTNLWTATSPITYPYHVRLGATARSQYQAVTNWKGQWAESTTYLLNNRVVGPDGKWYRCLLTHTSGTFSADLAANRWEESFVQHIITGASSNIITIYSVGNPSVVNDEVYVAKGADDGTRPGYTRAAGDVFVFKGGVTWGSTVVPLLVLWSGDSGAPVTYMGGQRCGAAGSLSCNGGVAWGTGYPVFDGADNGMFGTSGIIQMSSKSYIAVDGIKITGAGDLFTGGGYGIKVSGGSGITVKNCWLEPNGVNGFAYSTVAGSASAIYFHDNVIKKAGRVHFDMLDNTIDDVQIYNNVMYGSAADWVSQGYHGDGIMTGADGVGGHKATNLRIYNNKFLGDWSNSATAFIYLNGSSGHYGWNNAWIYNNVMTTENTSGLALSPGAVVVWNIHSNVKIFNNTIDMRSNVNVASHCINLGYSANNIEIKNNILTGCDNGVTISGSVSGTVDLDYNLYYTASNNHYIWDLRPAVNGRCNSLATCQAAPFSQEAHGIMGSNPAFVTLPSDGIVGSGNWRLQEGSPAINAGLDLSAVFTRDILANLRTGTWDLGAYEFGASGGGGAVQYTVNVTKSGAGTGSVSSSPAGINCGTTCNYDYDADTVVTLTATPTENHIFAGWSGAGCTGINTCVLTLTEVTSVTAIFNLPNQHTLTVTKAGAGAGTITSSPAGINCGATCSYGYDPNTIVTLTAIPTGDNIFAGWSGLSGCTGTGTCVLTLYEPHQATATFNVPSPLPAEIKAIQTGGRIAGGVLR